MRGSIYLRLLVLAVLLAAFGWSQTTNTGRIEGTVTDATGSVVPNVKVSAVETATKKATEVTTNSSGVFVLNALQSGAYTLTVEAAGFRRTVVQGIQLDVDAIVTQRITLEVGQVSESVEVKAETVSVQTSDAQLARTITMKDIDTLPQLARTPITLSIFAAPGVQVSQNGSSAGVDTSFSHINGARQGSNNNTLDGIDVNDAVTARLGLALTANNTDSVGEFRVITEGGKAEYGRDAGGQIELITRSGTNQFHGNAFDYLRNTDFNANDFFNNLAGVPRPEFNQNIFGGSFGGPIKHNKLFAFGNYQGRRTYQTITREREVPSLLARTGIFQYIPTGGTAIQQVNVLSLDPRHLGIDPFVANFLKAYPAPNNNNVGDTLNTQGFQFNNPNNSGENQLTLKFDYNMTNNMHFFFRESYENNVSIDSLNSADAPFPGQVQGTQGGIRWGVAAGFDWTITPTLVNEFRYGHQSALVAFNRPERIAGNQISSVNDGWTIPISAAFAQGRNSPVNEYTDNLTKVLGKHTLKAGLNLRFTTQFGFNDAGIYPNFNLTTGNGTTPPASFNPPGINSTDLTNFQGLYNNLTGRVNQITQTFYSPDLATFQKPGTPEVRNYIFHEYGAFIQDDWKLARNLTINIGLRWEFQGVPYELNGQQANLTPNVFDTVTQNSSLTAVKTNHWYKDDYKNFAPRFGFSWDPWGNGKTAIRGGYGIYYDRLIGATTSLVDGNTPGFVASALTPDTPNINAGSDVRISDNPALPQQPPSPVLTLPATRGFSVVVFNPNLKSGYVQQYSLTVQREIAQNTVLEVGYLGNRGVRLFNDVDLNQPRIYGDFLSSFAQLQACNPNCANVNIPAGSNSLVKLFGSAGAAQTALGSTTLSQGLARTAATTVENSFAKDAAAGISPFYLRNYPQFAQFIYGENAGRSYYDSMQISLRRQVGSLQLTANYTWSKSLDNGSTEGNGFTEPIDDYNLALNKARSDFDRPQVFTFSGLYVLPIGKGHRFLGDTPHWVNTLVGGWSLGGLNIWESGSVMTVSSGRLTGPSGNNSWINYSGSRNIGAPILQGNGVFFFNPTEITALTNPANFPTAGQIGTSGRNAFRGPRYFNIDASLVKRFAFTERQGVVFRAEAYNLVNNVNFANPGLSIATPQTFGKISSTVANARILQLALRYEF